MTDEQIDRKVLDVLAAINNREAWDAMTFESGPYSISRVKYWVTQFARAILADLPAPEPLTEVPTDKLNLPPTDGTKLL